MENRVAEELNKFFLPNGLSPVERIPVLGRKGPDISWNELILIIDEKSRKSCPKNYKVPTSEVRLFGELLGVRLCELELLLSNTRPAKVVRSSVTVSKWYQNMDDWTMDEKPDGITALVLHWPRTHAKNATLLIHQADRRVLRERFNHIHLVSCQ
jgi:hypothetical protein